MKNVILCGTRSCTNCPSVLVEDDGSAKIGDMPNFVSLTKEQWTMLKDKVKGGEFDE